MQFFVLASIVDFASAIRLCFGRSCVKNLHRNSAKGRGFHSEMLSLSHTNAKVFSAFAEAFFALLPRTPTTQKYEKKHFLYFCFSLLLFRLPLLRFTITIHIVKCVTRLFLGRLYSEFFPLHSPLAIRHRLMFLLSTENRAQKSEQRKLLLMFDSILNY